MKKNFPKNFIKFSDTQFPIIGHGKSFLFSSPEYKYVYRNTKGTEQPGDFLWISAIIEQEGE